MPAQQLAPGQQFGARYSIVSKIGEGGMGIVYLAEDTLLGRQVALKVPRFDTDQDSDQLKRFQREAKAAARIDHPNICPVFDVGQVDGAHYMTMPFIDGTPLAQLVSADRPWAPRQAAELVCQIGKAVSALHDKGLVHRDLKPSNIMVRFEGDPVLMDFGLAKAVGGSDKLTSAGQSIGTPAYMPPEQVLDASTIGPAADVYSLGVILFELLTGRRPFEGPLAAVYGQILHTPAPVPSSLRPDLDSQLDAICLKAMAKKEDERFGSVTALIDALSRYLGAETVPMPNRPPAPRPQPPTVPARPAADEDKVTCSACGRQLRVPGSLRGKRLKCPRCGASLGGAPEAPRPVTPPVVAVAAVTPTSPASPPDTVGEPAPAPRPAAVPKPPPIPPRAAPAIISRPPPLAPPPRPRRRSRRVIIAVVLAILLTALFWALVLMGGEGPFGFGKRGADPTKGETTNSIGMKLVPLPAGKFLMGSPDDEADREDDEGLHEVEITRPFHAGACEVTIGQFRRFIEATGHKTDAERSGGGCGYDAARANPFGYDPAYGWRDAGWPVTDEHPVANVSWNDAVAFCKWLSEKEGKAYGLPTEAEWEYACRAGTRTRFWIGDDLEGLVGAGNVPDASARKLFPDWTTTAGGDGHVFSAPVGQFRPNPWGLSDTHGNVWEWCADWYGPYDAGPVKGPKGPDSGDDRVLRGGSWFSNARYCRSADRFHKLPDTVNVNFGFRVVLRPQ